MRNIPLPWSILVLISVAAVITAFTVLMTRLLQPPVRLNAGAALIRAGPRTSAHSEVVAAQLLVNTSTTGRILNLLLRSGSGLRAVILARDPKGQTFTPDAAMSA